MHRGSGVEQDGKVMIESARGVAQGRNVDLGGVSVDGMLV